MGGHRVIQYSMQVDIGSEPNLWQQSLNAEHSYYRGNNDTYSTHKTKGTPTHILDLIWIDS